MRCTLRLPAELHRELFSIAQDQGWTLNGLIKKILWDWLREQQKAR